MKYAFVSDIHGNLQAWKQVWASLASEKVDGVICLGDIIGYGPRPAETLESVKSKINFCVIGNHDAVIVGLEDPSRFNEDAQNLIHWSAERLDHNAKEYFSEMPYELNLATEHEVIRCVHGSPFEPEMFWYVSNAKEARLAWDSTDTQITFIGHSHVPGYFTLSPDNKVKYRQGNNLLYKIEEGYRYIINAGSVGLSRDGDSRAAYCIYDSETRTFFWRRVDFDLEEYRQDVKNNMPDKTMASFVLDNFELSVETQSIKKFTNFNPSDETQRLTINRKATIQTINVRKNAIRRRRTGSTQNIQPIKKDKRPNPAKTKLIIFLISALLLAGIVAAIFIIGNSNKPKNGGKINIPEDNTQTPKVPEKPKSLPTTRTTSNSSNLTNTIMNAMDPKPVQPKKTVQTPTKTVFLLDDNFNSLKVGSKPKKYRVNKDSEKIEIAAIPSANDKSIIIKDTSSTTSSGMAKPFKQTSGGVGIKFKVKPEQTNHGLLISFIDGKEKLAFQIRITQAGTLGQSYMDGNKTLQVNKFSSYLPGKFMTLKVVADTEQGLYSLFKDNKPVFTKKPFINKCNNLAKIRFATGHKTTGVYYIDDLQVFTRK